MCRQFRFKCSVALCSVLSCELWVVLCCVMLVIFAAFSSFVRRFLFRLFEFLCCDDSTYVRTLLQLFRMVLGSRVSFSVLEWMSACACEYESMFVCTWPVCDSVFVHAIQDFSRIYSHCTACSLITCVACFFCMFFFVVFSVIFRFIWIRYFSLSSLLLLLMMSQVVRCCSCRSRVVRISGKINKQQKNVYFQLHTRYKSNKWAGN